MNRILRPWPIKIMYFLCNSFFKKKIEVGMKEGKEEKSVTNNFTCMKYSVNQAFHQINEIDLQI